MSDEESGEIQTLTPDKGDATVYRLGQAKAGIDRARRARQASLIEELATGAGIQVACEVVGVAYGTYRKWRLKYPDFAAKVDVYRNAPLEHLIGYQGTFAQFRKKYFGMDSTWFHMRIIDTLENAKPGSISLILLPPEHGKTTLLEDWCNYKLALDPNYRIAYGSGKIDHSKKVLYRIMLRMSSEGPTQEYVTRFGPFEPQEGRRISQTWNKSQFNVFGRKNFDERDFNMTALGMTSQIQGTRTDKLIVDDPQSLETLSQTEQMVNKFRQDWLSRPGQDGTTTIVGTRVGDADFYQELLDADLVDNLVCIPAHDEDDKWLWPERYTNEFYKQKQKQVGPIAWARNYMQDPISSGEETFTDAVIDPCKNPLISVLDDPKPKLDSENKSLGSVAVYLGIDPSIGGKNATIAARCDDKKITVLDLRVDEQLNSTSAIAAVANEYLYRYNIRGVSVVTDMVVETMAFQKGLSEDDAFNELKAHHGFAFRDHLTGYNKYDEDLGVAAMVRSFQRKEIEIPWADNRETQYRMGELIKELKIWRPHKRGTKLRQDRVMVLWFVWLRWRQAKGGYMTDTTQFDTRGLPYSQGKVLVGGRYR